MWNRRALLGLALAVSAWAQPVPTTAHPGLLRPASDPMARDAARCDAFPIGRAWHLEVRTRLAQRPARGCRSCDRRVIKRNADLCEACAASWRASGVRGWDFP